MHSYHRASRVVWVAILGSTLFGGKLAGDGVCPLPPPEPPVPDVGIPQVSAEDQQYLEDFGAALERFDAMSLEEFQSEFGPPQEYRSAPPFTFLRGDANRDFQVDLSDALCTLGFLFLSEGSCQSPSCEDPMDTDDDGTVSITDAVYLLGHLFLGKPSPPRPFPDSGADPTPDSLYCRDAMEPSGKLEYDPLGAEYVDLITETYPLSESQEEVFRDNGFVVLDDQRFGSFLEGFGRLFSLDMPVYISADSMMDALHLSFERVLMTVEKELLISELDTMLTKMEGGIKDLDRYSGGDDIEQELDDVAFWIGTARSLLAGGKIPSARGVDARVEEFLAYVTEEGCRSITLFGSPQVEDFSQFKPRSHYALSEELSNYFRAMMWTQRMGMKFMQLPRHASAAFLLSRCLDDTGAMDHWHTIDALVETFVGTSDSLTPDGMLDLASTSKVLTVSDFYEDSSFKDLVRTALETGAGRQLINSQVTRADFTDEGLTPIPPAYHLMGQRFIVDSFIFTNVVFDRVCRPGCPEPCGKNFPQECGRLMPSPLDAWCVLGNKATVSLLNSELETFDYHKNLAALDWIVASYDEEFWTENLYNVWLSSLRTLNVDTTQAPYPSVMQTEAWHQRILHAQLASWAQLRHDTLLYAKPSYTFVGQCDYPDAWVDPYPDLYNKLADFADNALARFTPLGVFDLPSGANLQAYFENLRAHSQKLASVAQAELEGMPLSEEQALFIKDVWKLIRGHYSPDYVDGWYQDLIFQTRDDWQVAPEGLSLPEEYNPTIADIHTDPNSSNVLHVGVAQPNLMLLSVKTDCATRAYLGPVFSYHEIARPNLHRMTDEEWKLETEETEWNPDREPPPRPEWTRAFIR